MKKFFKAVPAVALAFALALVPVSVNAADPGVTVDGVPVQFTDVRPTIVEERTLVPMREVFEAMGFTVYWDDDTSTATLTKAGYNVTATIGDEFITVNGQRRYGDVPPQIINDRFMLPVRLVAEGTGADVDWDGYNVVIVTADVRAVPSLPLVEPTPDVDAYPFPEQPDYAVEEVDGQPGNYVEAVHPIHILTPEELEQLHASMFDPETVQVIIDGNAVSMPTPFVNRETGLVMLPVAYVAEALGYTVVHEGEDVVIGPGITFTVGVDSYAFARMAPVELGGAPELLDGVLFVPWNFFGEVLPGIAAYIADGNIIINSNGVIGE